MSLKETEHSEELAKKLESLANEIVLVKNIISIEDKATGETYVYFIDYDDKQCMCITLSFLEEFLNKIKKKNKKGNVIGMVV